MSHGENLPSILPIVQDNVTGTANRVEGVLTDFLMLILSKTVGELIRESLIKIHQLISGNVASVASNLGGGRHVHLALTMTAEDYLAQMGYVFVPPHNSIVYPPMTVLPKIKHSETKCSKKTNLCSNDALL